MINAVGIFLLLIINTQMAWSFDLTSDPLAPGQCVADPLSKNYLSNPLLSHVDFTCTYTCMDQFSKKHLVTAKHSEEKKPYLDEMNSLICDKVTIDLTKSQLGYVLKQKIHSSSFWAEHSPRAEIRQWALTHQGLIPESEKRSLKLEMNKIFIQVGNDLLKNSPTNEIIQFASNLLEIGSETEKGNSLLKNYLEVIETNGILETSVDQMTIAFIKSYGPFLLKTKN